MKKRNSLSVLLMITVLLAIALCGTVLAYMFRQTEHKDNQFTPAEVSCKITEEFDGTQKTSIQIQNTGNIDAYLRVRFVSYWVDADGNIASKPSVMPEISHAAGWLKGSNNTYYYQTPVVPGENTGELLSSQIVLAEEDGYFQVVEVFAEAIQSQPANAAANSWKVTVDQNGSITDVP